MLTRLQSSLGPKLSGISVTSIVEEKRCVYLIDKCLSQLHLVVVDASFSFYFARYPGASLPRFGLFGFSN